MPLYYFLAPLTHLYKSISNYSIVDATGSVLSFTISTDFLFSLLFRMLNLTSDSGISHDEITHMIIINIYFLDFLADPKNSQR